jgi:hypothetical protein
VSRSGLPSFSALYSTRIAARCSLSGPAIAPTVLPPFITDR